MKIVYSQHQKEIERAFYFTGIYQTRKIKKDKKNNVVTKTWLKSDNMFSDDTYDKITNIFSTHQSLV